ncbi:MAG TPA: tetratricopeptide repeat protein [Candidatus Acidoferrum sp.]
MNRFAARCLFVFVPSLLAASAWAQAPAHIQPATDRTKDVAPAAAPMTGQPLFGALPLATHSEEARKLIETSIEQYENVLLDNSVSNARKAAAKDPHSALAFAVWSYAARRDRPSTEALHRAEALAAHATPQEKLLVRWMINVQQGNTISAISTMNDLLAQYPENKHILYLTSEWLYFQQDYDRARTMMEKMLKLDPDFPPALNMLGYAYIETGNPNPTKAIAYLKRYAALQPNQPNPEDSLGEIYRFAGDDQSSLQHYAAALKITPTFITSQVGLGDTATLMGNFAQARAEYDKAIPMATSSRDRLHAQYQKALAYFWEGQPVEGRKALDELSIQARKQKDGFAQFEISYGRALLNPNIASEIDELHALEVFLQTPQPGMSESERNTSLASVLREEVRTNGLNRRAEAAQNAAGKLEHLASTTRDSIIQDNYDSARGYQLFAKGNFAAAADDLGTDSHSPMVLQELALAYDQVGNAQAAASVRTRLKYLRASTVEWYLAAHSGSSAN